MTTLNYSTTDIQAGDINVFSDMLAYISEYIYKIHREKDRVVLDIEEGKEAEVLEKIEQLRKTLALDEVRSGKDISTKILEDHRGNEPANCSDVFAELTANGSVWQMTDGAYAYTGLFLDVYKYFSRKIEAFGKANFEGIEEYEESVLYPVCEYEKGHYFESFPHHTMFQTNLKSDQALLERFSKEGAKNPDIFSNENMRHPHNVIRHAACVPIYPLLEDAEIDEDKPRYFLIGGKCFRHEGANTFELSRLNEFYMKEYVCVGTFEQTLDMIERARELWHEWIDIFSLKATIETANDSFFASNYKKLKIFQLLGDSKQEFRVYIPQHESYCAASSSNVHRTHFSKTYNIHSKHAYCQTSCFAFGLERLAYTLLCQKGTDPERWDEATRREIFS